MLPPDNFQEDPKPGLAHRTSPTNLGLYLLSTVSARDFGWIGTLDAVERLEATLRTMVRLQRFRGHFYNWYDTRDLRPLDPRYVSSVDSGNLAAHLLTVANAAREWLDVPVTPGDAAGASATRCTWQGQALQALPARLRTQSIMWQQLQELWTISPRHWAAGQPFSDIAALLQTRQPRRPRWWISPGRSPAKAAITLTAICCSGRTPPIARGELAPDVRQSVESAGALESGLAHWRRPPGHDDGDEV